MEMEMEMAQPAPGPDHRHQLPPKSDSAPPSAEPEIETETETETEPLPMMKMMMDGGEPMGWIFSVDINQPALVYGTVKAGEEPFSPLDYLFRYERDVPIKSVKFGIKPCNNVRLSGPTQYNKSFWGRFVISLDLWHKAEGASQRDKKLGSGVAVWKPNDKGNEYNVPTQAVFCGDDGARVTVNYVVFSHAVAAGLKVTFVKGSKADQDELFIAARISGTEPYIIPLLVKGSASVLRPFNLLWLERRLVYLPFDSKLSVDLRIGNSLVTKVFCPRLSGTDKEFFDAFDASNCEIRVEVIWQGFSPGQGFSPRHWFFPSL